MSSSDHAAVSPPQVVADVHPGKGDVERLVHTSALVETWPEGDADMFARAFARILVRQVLREMAAVDSREHDDAFALAG